VNVIAQSAGSKTVESLRLAIVAPRFWPLWGDAERRALLLAESLIEEGHRVTVVSPRWRRTWPAEMCVGLVPLVRLRGSHRTGWSTLRWMYFLSRWLKEQVTSSTQCSSAACAMKRMSPFAHRAKTRVPVSWKPSRDLV
jgi:hypothetical protein